MNIVPLLLTTNALGAGGGWSPLSLHQPGDILIWYDPSDLTTMFQDTAGTIPVTADGQSVALIRDKGPGGYHRTQATGPSMPKYKTDGTYHWLLYDGSDDSNATSSIDWGTDEVEICTGITKSSDAATAIFAEFSASHALNDGSFVFLAPLGTLSSQQYGWRSKGTVLSSTTASTNFAAPITNIASGRGKISTDVALLRLDGTDVASSSSDQGTGNFGNFPLYFGRRDNTSFPFNGKEHQTIIRNRVFSVSERANLEAFVAAAAGITI